MARSTHDTARAAAIGVALISGCYTGIGGSGEEAAVDALAGASADEGGADDGGDDDDGSADLEFVPGPQVLPRLTQTQYRNALRDLLGPDLPSLPLEEDTKPYLFESIGASTTALSEGGVELYERSADAVTHAVFDDATRRAELVGCAPAAPGDACVEAFLADFGRRAFRRPLPAAEVQRWVGLATQLAGGDAWQGIRLAVSGMLQAPSFLYRVELGEPDPDDADRLRYTSVEMASRLSFLLWNTIPDAELLDVAETGALATEAGLVQEAERMLADPRARETVQEFFAQYLDLGRLDGVTRDPMDYPHFSSTLIESMRSEVALLVDDLVYRRDVDVRQLFSTRSTFVNAELAALYGVEAPGASAITFVPVELPEDGPRAGLLTLGAFLTMNAHETYTSPTLRGKYVRERVLCQTIPPPPDNVDTTVEEDGEPKTGRERLEQHRTDPACSGCHALLDPPGFLFEHFDNTGAYRTLDNGFPIDASGDLDGTPLAGARDLADALADEEAVGRCIVTQLFRHAQGRLETEDEEAALDDLHERFAAEDHRFGALLVQLVTHDSFRFVTEQTEAP
jgi:hypothetical protein